ncbi:MAG: hypothetical protein ABIA04_11770 [Pseudomonadota bacterium]
MTKSFRIIFALFIMLSCFLSAVDLDLEGYFRVRGDTFRQLDLNDGMYANYRSYIDQRFRFNPTLIVTDNILIKTQIDVLDNAFFGDSAESLATSSTPAVYAASSTDETPEAVSDIVATSLAFTEGQSSSFIYLKRAWAEILFPVGYLKLGRQPSHFGLGIFENAGNGLDDNFGNTVDRISFETGFSDYEFSIGYDKEVEIDDASLASNRYQAVGVDTSDDDTNRIFIQAGLDSEDRKLLARISKKWGGAYDLSSWIYDVYAVYKKDWFKFSSEFLSAQGSLGQRDIDIYNYALRFEGLFKYLNIGFEHGCASGTESGPSNTTVLGTLPFNRDYNISHILFEESLPGGAQADGSDEDNENVLSAGRSGSSVSNAFYFRAFTDFKFGKYLRPGINIISALPYRSPFIGYDPDDVTNLGYASSKWYGIEYDIYFNIDQNENLSYGLLWGHFIPGGIFDEQQNFLYPIAGDTNTAEQAWTIQWNATIRF